MPIRAKSADGKIHQFPDGTDRAVIDRVMKDYATKAQRPTFDGMSVEQRRLAGAVYDALPESAKRSAIDPRAPRVPGTYDPNAPYEMFPKSQPSGPSPSAPGYGDPLGMLRDAFVGTTAKAVQGATLGFGDEIAGLVSSDAQDAMRREQTKYEKVNPLGATVAEIGGAGLSALYAAPAALSTPLGLGGRLARSGGLGVVYGGLTGLGNAEGSFQDRLPSAGLGATIGGIAGLGAEAVAPLARRVFMGAPPPPAATPQMAAARDLPVPVPLTRGQATGDTNLLGAEYALAADSRSGAGPIMRQFADEQQAALLANRDALQQQIAGNAPAVARGEGGAMVSARLNEMRDAAKRNVDNLYDTARAAGDAVTINPDVALGTGQRMATAIRANHAVENIPGVVREIDRLAGYANNGPVPVRTLFETRQRLSSMRANRDEQAVAAGTAIRELDAAIDDALELSLLSGDEAGVTAWREAIAANRDFARTYKGKDFVAALTERDRADRTILKTKPEEAANYIFGSAELGLVSKRDMASNLARLRDQLGAESPEWGAIKQEGFMRFADQALGAMGPNGRSFSGAKLAKAWEDANRKSPEVMNRLFTGEERRDIGNWVNVARNVTVKEGRVFNASGSAYRLEGLAGLINRGAARIPVLREFFDVLRGVVGIRNAGRAERMATEAISGVPPALRAPRSGVPAALLAQPPAMVDYTPGGR